MKKDSFFYRFLIFTIVYVFAAATLLLSFSNSGALPSWGLYTVIGVLIGGYFLALLINEIVVHKRKG
jgi:hypothetical protein